MTGGGGDRSLPCVLEPFKAVCPTATRPKNAAGRGGSPRPGPSLGPPTSTYSVRSVIPGPRVLRRPRAERQPQAQPQQQEHGGGESAAVHWDQAGRARGTAPRLRGCRRAPPRRPPGPAPRAPRPRPAPRRPRSQSGPSRVPTAPERGCPRSPRALLRGPPFSSALCSHLQGLGHLPPDPKSFSPARCEMLSTGLA